MSDRFISPISLRVARALEKVAVHHQIVRDDTQHDPAMHAVFTMVATAVESMSAFQTDPVMFQFQTNRRSRGASGNTKPRNSRRANEWPPATRSRARRPSLRSRRSAADGSSGPAPALVGRRPRRTARRALRRIHRSRAGRDSDSLASRRMCGTARQVLVAHIAPCFACRRRLPIAIGDSAVRTFDRVDPQFTVSPRAPRLV